MVESKIHVGRSPAHKLYHSVVLSFRPMSLQCFVFLTTGAECKASNFRVRCNFPCFFLQSFSLCWREKHKKFPLIPKIPYNMTGQRSNKKIANEADNYAGTLIFDFTASGQELSLQEAI